MINFFHQIRIDEITEKLSKYKYNANVTKTNKQAEGESIVSTLGKSYK